MTVLFCFPPSSPKGLPGGSDAKESPCNVADLGSTLASRRSPGGGHGNPLQYSCLENPMDGGAWWVQSWTGLSSSSRLREFRVLHTLINTWCD